MSANTPWPPRVGELLPGAAEAIGARRKLASYSLNAAHQRGGSKAGGFARILGITVAEIDYLEGAVLTGILLAPVSSIRESPPWGLNCVVMVPVRGVHEKRHRVVEVRTVWELVGEGSRPRLVNALCGP